MKLDRAARASEVCSEATQGYVESSYDRTHARKIPDVGQIRLSKCKLQPHAQLYNP